MADYKLTGSCLCGGVKFEITKRPSYVHYCHCSMCRKSIGADFATDGAVPLDHFKFLKNDTLKEYSSSEGAIRCFCGVCGCSVLGKTREGGKYPDLKCVFIFFGTLDGDPGANPEYHIYASDKAPWVKINDGLPQCAANELFDIEGLKAELQ